MKAATLALPLLLLAATAAANHTNVDSLVAAGEANVGPDSCGGRHLALAGAKPPGGSWLMTLTAVNDDPSIPGCSRPFVFAGDYDWFRGSCLAPAAALPEDLPLVLCVGPAPATVGLLAVRLCWADFAPCAADEAFLSGDLVGTLRHVPA